MPSAVLIIDDLGPQSAECIFLLSRSFSVGIAEIRNSVERGLPVLERKIFDRKDATFPMRLAKAFTELDALKCQWKAFEVLEGQRWVPSGSYFQLTAERVQNMISARQDSLDHQRHISEIEDDEK